MILPQTGQLKTPTAPPWNASDRQAVLVRQKLLDTVRRRVRSRSEQSLHQAVLFNSLEPPSPELTKRPCNILVRLSGSATFPLSPDASLSEIFAQSQGTLLILGAPGSGKTTLLLKLSLELIARSMNEAAQPIPVILNLSQWQSDRPFTDWIAAQLHTTYHLPLHQAQTGLDTGQFILLFDEFDRLTPDQRQPCLQAIEQLLAATPNAQKIVVCARLDHYKNAKIRLHVNGAMWLQPLNDNQIRDYLLSARSRELWQAIRTEPPLLELARSPFFLTVMTLADEEILFHAWRRLTTPAEQQTYLLNAFIRRMLIQEISQPYYPKNQEPRPEQVRTWLTHLAQWMEHRQTTEMAIAQIQPPDWLNAQQLRRYHLEISLLGGFILGLIVFILLQFYLSLSLSAIAALISALLFSLLWSKLRPPQIIPLQNEPKWRTRILGIIAIAPLFGILGGLGVNFALTALSLPPPPLIPAITALVITLILTLQPALTCLQVLILRSLLSRYHILPWNLKRFCNYAASRLLLQRINGHYRFIHPLLQTHFARMS